MSVTLVTVSLVLSCIILLMLVYVLLRLSALSPIVGNAERTERAVRDEIARSREEGMQSAKYLREELGGMISRYNDSVSRRMAENADSQTRQLAAFSQQLQMLMQLNEQKFEKLRETVEQRLQHLQQDNNLKLEQMRVTVDEKLNATLEQRLGESFKLVCDRLEAVHKGLGEMQTLASGVGDLKRVLSNVKARGIWSEIHLANLIEEMFTPEQYALNLLSGCPDVMLMARWCCCRLMPNLNS